MAYNRPQRIIDKSFDTFVRATKEFNSKVTNSMQGIANSVMKQKRDQDALTEKQDDLESEMLDKANSFGSTGDAMLDENIVGFWNDKVEEYFRIKNAMQRGDISRREGNLALKRIEGLPAQFKSQANYLANQVSLYNDVSGLKTGAPGSISSVSSQESQQVLRTMSEGGNVQIVERGGVLYYYTPDTVDENGNVIKKGAMLNGSELVANQAINKNLFETIQDISPMEEQLFNKSLNTDDIVDETFIQMKVEEKDGKIYKSRVIKDPEAAQTAILESPMMNAIINDKSMMTTYFQDVIPDAGEDGYSLSEFYNSDEGKAMRDAGITEEEFVNSRWGEMVGEPDDPKNEALASGQEQAARKWIANDTLNKFTPGLNSIKGNYFSIENKPKKEKSSGDDKNKPYEYGKGVGDQVQTMGGAYEDTIEIADELYADPNTPPTTQQIYESLINNPAIDETDNDFYMGDGTPDGGKLGVLYHDNVPVSMGKFKTKKAYEDYVFRQIGMKPETIGHFRKENPPPKYQLTEEDKKKIEAAKPGESITLGNGKTIRKTKK
tara:strand:+ start:108 stop:1757 length:1650 start_codon:yes stop_codon:yes gene_type:complete